MHVLFVRQQKILGSKSYYPKVPANTEPVEVLSAFLLQFYLSGSSGQQIPPEIVLPIRLDDTESLALAVSEAAGRKVRITAAKRGEKSQYLSLAQKNAEIACDSRQSAGQKMKLRYAALQLLLALEDSIQRMECFDISHTMGQATIASCVVFDGEGPHKQEYRRYNVTGITGGDDYAAMQFALDKRYSRLTDETKIPDIIFIDGGQGQLNIALTQFSNWPHQKMPLLIGIAKGVSRKPGLETLILWDSGKQLHLPSDSPALHLIQQIRDEAHRFAITGHRNKRGKSITKSPLENIAGIGEKRRQSLLQYLGGLQGVMKASVLELSSVPGISRSQAEKIYQACHNK